MSLNLLMSPHSIKKAKRMCKENYRPVSILTSLSKVFESAFCNQLYEFFDIILSKLLSVFRKKYICQTALIRMIESWKSATYYGSLLVTWYKKYFSARNIFFPQEIFFSARNIFFSARNIFFRKKYFSPQEIYFSPQEIFFFRKKYFSPQEIYFSPQEIFFSARNIFFRKKYFFPQEIYFFPQEIYFFRKK